MHYWSDAGLPSVTRLAERPRALARHQGGSSITPENRPQRLQVAINSGGGLDCVQHCRGLRRCDTREFARYLDISIKSASEVDSRLQLLRDEGNLRYEVWQPVSERVIRVRKMAFRLRSSVIAADEADQNQRAKKPKRTDG